MLIVRQIRSGTDSMLAATGVVAGSNPKFASNNRFTISLDCGGAVKFEVVKEPMLVTSSRERHAKRRGRESAICNLESWAQLVRHDG